LHPRCRPKRRGSIFAGQNITNFGVSMTAADLFCAFAGCGSYYGPSGYDNVGTLTNPTDIVGQLGLYPYQASGVPSNLVQFNDPHTVHVYAVQGSLTGISLATSERASLRAGLDIVYPILNIENAASTDVSLIQAGRDITSCQPGLCQLPDLFNIRVEGPGTLQVLAGRNIFALTSTPTYAGQNISQGIGIESVGNADNPLYLPAFGAAIDMMVGVGSKGPDVTGFINTYTDPANAGSITQNYLGQLVTYMDQLEGITLSPARALADFRALPPAQQLHRADLFRRDQCRRPILRHDRERL
jgi:filamentous hemagglutinin